MNSSHNKYDALENLIFTENIRIASIQFQQEEDTMFIHLNSKAILKQKISGFPKLKEASNEQLQNHVLIGEGTGVHWPHLDEDLSLKGFLQEEIKNIVLKAA